MDNRRREHRYPVTVAVQLLAGERSFWGKVVNLSSGGVGIRGDEALEAGSRVQLILYLWEDNGEPDRTLPLQLEGRVAWFRMPHDGGNLAGVQFDSLNAAQKVALKLYMDRFHEGG